MEPPVGTGTEELGNLLERQLLQHPGRRVVVVQHHRHPVMEGLNVPVGNRRQDGRRGLALPASQERGQIQGLAIGAGNGDREPPPSDRPPLVKMVGRHEHALAEEHPLVIRPGDRRLGAEVEEPSLAAVDTPADDVGAVRADR